MKRHRSTTRNRRPITGLRRFAVPLAALFVVSCGGGGGSGGGGSDDSENGSSPSDSNIGVSLAIGASDTIVGLSRSVASAEFFRSTDFYCDTSQILLCPDGQQSTVNGTQFTDDSLTTAQGSNYWLELDGVTSHPARIEVSSGRFTRRQYHRIAEFRDKLWMTGGDDGTAANPGIWSSSDGINWINEDDSDTVSFRILHDMTVFDDRLWIVGGFHGTRLKDVHSSMDGVTWVEETLNPPFAARDQHQLVTFQDKLWLIGGYDGSSRLNDVWSSVDGVNWTEETDNAAFSPRFGHQVVVFDDRLWLIGGYDGDDLNDVWSSVDGVNWVEETPAAAFGARQTTATVLNGRMWIAGGGADVGATTFGDVWSSSNGIDWVEETAMAAFGGRQQSQLAAFHGRLHIVAGFNPANTGVLARLGDNWSSADGSTWRNDSGSQPFAGVQAHGLVEHDGRLWIVGGENPTIPGNAGPLGSDEVWYTSDGYNWTRATDDAGFDLRHGHATVSYDGKLWVIGGINRFGSVVNDVWSSTDGIDWTEVNAAAAFDQRTLHRVTVFNGLMWLMGGWDDSGTHFNDVYSSADGVTWTPVATSGDFVTARFGHAFYSFGGKLWILGGVNTGVDFFDQVFSSVDGSTWVEEIAQDGAPFDGREGHRVIEHDGRLWLMGGSDGSTTRNDVWSSVDGTTWVEETSAAAFSARAYHDAASFDGRMWVVGGMPNRDNQVWLSDDGQEWRRAWRTEISFR